MNKFAVIGFGRWGKVLINEFSKFVDIDYAVNKGNRNDIVWLKKNFPKIKHTVDIDLVLRKKDIGSVIIATPITTHYALAKKSLEYDKNVFVEKPPCLTFKEGMELLNTAKKKNKALFVNNTFSFDPAFVKLTKLIGKETIQKTKFTWLKWGTFKSDIMWNLAYHDVYLSLILYGEPQRSRIVSRSADKAELELGYKNHRVSILINRSYKGTPIKSIRVIYKQKEYFLQNSNLYSVTNNQKKLIFKSEKSPLEIACREFINETHKKEKNYSEFNLSVATVGIIEKLSKNN